jgi:glycerol transport system substrate-binding protein
MAWLWAQFAVSKTVSLKKFLVGGTPIRKSTVFAEYLDDKLTQWGGLIEFYRSPVEKRWTDTGLNVPDYPTLSALWWPNIARAIVGDISPQEAMNNIAFAMDEAMSKMRMVIYSPRLNERRDPQYWLAQPGSPKPERPEESPQTIPYDKLILQWTQAHSR